MTTTAIATPDEPNPEVVPGQRAVIANVAFTHLPFTHRARSTWCRWVSWLRWPHCSATGCGQRWPCSTYTQHLDLDAQLATGGEAKP